MGPINVLLWGYKSWNLNKCNWIKLKVFHHSAIRCILGIGMDRVIEQHITNELVRFDFKCIPSINVFITCRLWCYIGKAYQDNDSLIQNKCPLDMQIKKLVPHKNHAITLSPTPSTMSSKSQCQIELMIKEFLRPGLISLRMKVCGSFSYLNMLRASDRGRKLLSKFATVTPNTEFFVVSWPPFQRKRAMPLRDLSSRTLDSINQIT